ncbi:MAG: FkbM family methyltransferase [bacterium]
MRSSRVGKYTIWYENAEEFRILKREIFGRNDYYVELESDNPVIVDAGAYIGDTTLYFKQLYPNARIIALEPFPHSFEILKKNVEENQLTGVELVQSALAPKSGEVILHADISGHDWFTTVSHIKSGWDKRQKTQELKVRGVSLSEVVVGPIDLLKMDIEGMEVSVLKSLVGEFPRIKNIIAEVHPVGGRFPKEILRLLGRRAGYKIEVRVEGRVVRDPEKVTTLSIVSARRQK